MATKKVGYEFWNDILGSPKFVAAPMVDMSELAFRMLCRKYNSQLCYSPMMHSQQFSTDFLYRQDNFSSCPEDQPLIVQFCANDPDIFLSAAKLVSSQCNAVDLNLGCPQAIARKGYYGAFLEDDWDTIHSIVKKAWSELPVPVTCKIRPLSGHYKRSVEYAQMLERSGCSVIAIHGRTRDQKGHNTGSASWEVIRQIKENVKIPVIANGNVLSFEDAQKCLEFTGADAVMSAEALLHNPALFTGTNPPVWEMVEEYLQLAEMHNTNLKFVRCHFFRLLYLCIFQVPELRKKIIEAHSFADFYSMLKSLKDCANEFQTFTHPGVTPQVQHKNTTNSKTEIFDEVNVNVDDALFCEANKGFNKDDCSIQSKFDKTDENFNVDDSNHLPFWICHSRLRISDNEATRGCYSKYFGESEMSSKKESTVEDCISKNKRRKAQHYERTLSLRKELRKVKKIRKKQKIAEMKKNQSRISNAEKGTCDPSEKLTKRQKKDLIRQKLIDAQGNAPKICINLGFSSSMETRELNKLSCQLRRLYGSNRHSENPVHLYFCNFSPSDELFKICVEKNDGFTSYVIEMSEKNPEDLFCRDDLVYLSPDSENVLESLDDSKVYVIGGIIDETGKKGLSLKHAELNNVKAARLPIAEHLVKCSANPGTMVLTVNQVFDILLKYYECKDWTTALIENVPQRKGYCAPENKQIIKETLDNSEESQFEESSTLL